MITAENLAVFIIELVAVAIDYTLGLVLLSKTVKLESTPPRRYYMGVVGVFLTHSICRTVFLIRGYFVDTSMVETRAVMFDVGTTFGLLCVALLVIVIESTIFTRSRRIFTIVGFCALGVMIIDMFTRLTFPPYRLLVWVQYFTSPILVAFIIATYLRALLKASGTIRTNAMVMLVAIALFALSELANSTISVQLLGVVAKYLGPALMVATLVLLYYAVVHLSIWKKKEQLGQEAGDLAGNT